MQLELIARKVDSPLWLARRLDQRGFTSREAPMEVHYEWVPIMRFTGTI